MPTFWVLIRMDYRYKKRNIPWNISTKSIWCHVMQNIGLKLVTRCLFPRLASVQSSDIRHTGRWAAGLGSWAAGRADGTNSDKLLHLTPIRAGAGAWSRSSRAANEPSRSFIGPCNFMNLVWTKSLPNCPSVLWYLVWRPNFHYRIRGLLWAL